LGKKTIEQELDSFHAKREAVRDWSGEWSESVESSNVTNLPAGSFANRLKLSLIEMRHMLCLIQLRN
jgi:hypothetical protein